MGTLTLRVNFCGGGDLQQHNPKPQTLKQLKYAITIDVAGTQIPKHPNPKTQGLRTRPYTLNPKALQGL